MKNLLKHFAPTVLLIAFCGSCSAGPTVVVHPKSAGVTIRDSKFNVVQELKDPKQIKIVQDAFLRAKRVGDTSTKLRSPTHKIDFSDRWLVDIKTGEISVLTKVVTDVYQLDPKDLVTLKTLLEPTAEQSGGGNSAALRASTFDVLQKMKSRTAAGLIAGMLQGTKHINPVWDTLPKSTIDEFLRTWTNELHNWNAESTSAIIGSIIRHDDLRGGWNLLDEQSRETRRQVIESIAANLDNEEAEQVGAGNGLAPVPDL